MWLKLHSGFSTLLALLIVSTFSTVSWAQEVYEYSQSVKDLGRGGVRITTETDGAMMLYNPAMLAFTKGIRWSIADVGFGVGGTNGSNNLTLVQSNPAPNNLNPFFGNNVWVGGTGRSSFALPNFGFAGYENEAYDLLVQNPANPTVSLSEVNDVGYLIGGAFNLSPSLAFGVNLKRVTRTGGNTISIGPGNLLSNLNNIGTYLQSQLGQFSTGTGYGVDTGLIWKPNVTANPMVSLCWQDTGYTSFYSATGTNPPPPIEDNLTLGLTAHQEFLGFGWGAGLEYRHINNVDVDISKKFNAGIELNLLLLDARYGFYQGWPGYGASVDLWLLSIDAAYYTVERGTVAGQLPDYRYQVGVSIEAGFDPFFNISEFGSKNRRLKQRR